MSDDGALAISRLSTGYDRRLVVEDLDVAPIARGQVVSLVGPNAAGKTTLLRALAGLHPATGSVRLGARELVGMPLAERSRLVTYMPQTLPQRVALTVLEAVLGSLRAAPLEPVPSRDALVERAYSVLDRMGIGALAMNGLDRLSGGQRQLASLAQAVVRSPRVLLLDEPISALDLHYQLRVMQLVRALAREHGTIVVMVLHDLALAGRWSDRIIVLAGGKVAADGAAADAITPAILADVYRVVGRVEAGPGGLHIDVEDTLPLHRTEPTETSMTRTSDASKPPPPNPRGRSTTLRFAVVAALLVGALVAAQLLTARSRAPKAAEPAAAPAKLVDLRGRDVVVRAPFRRLAIDDSRYLVALGLVHPEPASLLAAWPHDVNRLGDATYRQLLARAPGLEKLPKIASSAGTFDVESLLGANPDVAILSLESGVTDEQIARVEASGFPVVVVDFFVKPLENLERSLLLLGALTGREAQAREFVDFRAAHVKRVADRVAALAEAERPTVLLEAHAGMSPDCCNSPGRGNVGDYLTLVGAKNIGADVISQSFGKLNIEYVISRDPAVYIGTGGPHLEKAGGLVLGAGYDQERARSSLAKVLERRGISGLSAVKTGRAHGFAHQLVNSPLDVIAIEAFARWAHPERFADVDPAATLAEINRRFLATPYEGVYWVDARP